MALTRAIYAQETLAVTLVVVVEAVTNGISRMNTGKAAKHPTTHNTNFSPNCP